MSFLVRIFSPVFSEKTLCPVGVASLFSEKQCLTVPSLYEHIALCVVLGPTFLRGV